MTLRWGKKTEELMHEFIVIGVKKIYKPRSEAFRSEGIGSGDSGETGKILSCTLYIEVKRANYFPIQYCRYEIINLILTHWRQEKIGCYNARN